MVARSVSFLRHAWDADRGAMRNFMSYERRWLDEGHDGDHIGRAAWALGEVLSVQPPAALHGPALRLLTEMLGALGRQDSPRTHALTVLGLARAGVEQLGPEGAALLERLADGLALRQRSNGSEDWYWPEDVLAYDNARLPQALIVAGVALQRGDLVQEGVRSLDWYAAEMTHEDGYLRVTGHELRHRGQPRPGKGDEQPLDVAALVEAEVDAYAATGDEVHAQRAVHAFEWFLGRNRLGLAVYDFATGGCHDGLGATAVNENEGAESTLSYLQARLALEAAGLQANLPEPSRGRS